MTSQAVHGPVAVQDTSEEGVATVTIQGDVDAAAVPVVARYLAQVLRRGPRLIVFDLSDVGFMDCAAATAIIGAGRGLPGSPGPVLCHARPLVRRLLSLTGLDAQCTVSS